MPDYRSTSKEEHRTDVWTRHRIDFDTVLVGLLSTIWTIMLASDHMISFEINLNRSQIHLRVQGSTEPTLEENMNCCS